MLDMTPLDRLGRKTSTQTNKHVYVEFFLNFSYYTSSIFQKDSKDEVFNVASEIRQIGNSLFKEKRFEKARKKYSKALRYINVIVTLKKKSGG